MVNLEGIMPHEDDFRFDTETDRCAVLDSKLRTRKQEQKMQFVLIMVLLGTTVLKLLKHTCGNTF